MEPDRGEREARTGPGEGCGRDSGGGETGTWERGPGASSLLLPPRPGRSAMPRMQRRPGPGARAGRAWPATRVSKRSSDGPGSLAHLVRSARAAVQKEAERSVSSRCVSPVRVRGPASRLLRRREIPPRARPIAARPLRPQTPPPRPRPGTFPGLAGCPSGAVVNYIPRRKDTLFKSQHRHPPEPMARRRGSKARP